MSYLADGLAKELIISPWYPEEERARLHADLIREVRVVPRFLIDNVMEFYFKTSPKICWEVWNDFPNVAPPFEAFWVEGRFPDQLNMGGTMKSAKEFAAELRGPLIKQCGYFCNAVPLAEDGEWWGWSVSGSMYCRYARGSIVGPLGTVVIPVRKDGTPTCTTDLPPGLKDSFVALLGQDIGDGVATVMGWSREFVEWVMEYQSPKPTSSEVIEMVSSQLQMSIDGFKPIMLALSFLHCKNVKVREQRPPPRLMRARKKKRKGGLLTYKVLDIEPMRIVLSTEGSMDEVGPQKALHICRGHFAHYTEDAPLFGRVTGSFWRTQHYRGSAHHGVVKKDYRVHPPKGG